MDMFALYTLVIVLSIIVVTVRKRFGSRSGDDEEESIHSNGSIRTQKSGLHAAHFTILGTEVKANSDIHCEVLKYLRKRYASSSEYQIEVDADNDTVTLIHSK
ncbi:hypothetical protein QR680_008028 [Steinernema hermaphroditum]|uniref:Uncharacterized protein n=1 Tax=Steinernema hermaphroditum TaxID=289476 RepID=A0AA39IH98_9BILA|nr:hypothetical protein QR680_008028 [Steinernema hermaphroditum]